MINKVSSISIDQLLDNSKLTKTVSTTGFLHINFEDIPVYYFVEAMILPALINFFNPSSILEIGTSAGNTAAVMKMNAPNAEVVSVDLDEPFQNEYTKGCLMRKNKVGCDISTLGLDGKIELVKVDPRQGLESYNALNRKFDLILIDGDHNQSAVKKDTEFAQRVFSGNGAILWHDYYLFPDYIQDPESRGVYPVVQQFAQTSQLDVRHILGTCFAIAANSLPSGQQIDLEKMKKSHLNRNIRVKHLYGG